MSEESKNPQYSEESGAAAHTRRPPPFRGDGVYSHRPKRGGAASLVLKKSLTCANCGAPIELRAAGKSQRAVCGSCGSILDLTTPEQKVLQAFKEKAPTPLIPLGTRGKLKGTEWECLALLVREDVESKFRWREYLLFNPYKGYRFLMESAGHWNWVVMSHDAGQVVGTWVVHRGKRYRGFHKGSARVVAVVGEVYWEVSQGETVKVLDAVAPPFLVSIESGADEENWSLSEYLAGAEVAKAFKLSGPLPTPEGVAPNQLNPHGGVDGLRKTALWGGMAVATLLQFGSCVVTPRTTHFKTEYQVSDFLGYVMQEPGPKPSAEPSPLAASAQASPAPWVAAAPMIYPSPGPSLIPRYVLSDPFEFKGAPQWVDLEVETPGLSNQWVEVEATLIDEDDGGDEAQAVLGVEYYHGYSDGESWSEGSRSQTHSFPNVEEGRYRLRLEAMASAPPDQKIIVKARTGVKSFLNYVLVLFLLSVGALVPDREKRFETQRWEDSTV